MERLTGGDYFSELSKRSKTSRAYAKHQLVGLEIADLLSDRAHKALYIKLAKEFDTSELLRVAKSVADMKGITNPGAYFMRIITASRKHG